MSTGTAKMKFFLIVYEAVYGMILPVPCVKEALALQCRPLLECEGREVQRGAISVGRGRHLLLP